MADRIESEPKAARDNSLESSTSDSGSAQALLFDDAYDFKSTQSDFSTQKNSSNSDNSSLNATSNDSKTLTSSGIESGLPELELEENNAASRGNKKGSDRFLEKADPTEITDKGLDRNITDFEGYLGGFKEFSPEKTREVGENLRQTFNRLEGVGPEQYGKDSANTQVTEIMANMKKVMDSSGSVKGKDVLSKEDQAKIVEDMARSSADPKTYVNQGTHNDCVAQSIRLAHMTTDPADATRIGAEIATTGKATLNGAEGDKPYEVNVDASSIKLDFEASVATEKSTGTDGRRGGFGQMYSLALNEATNDARAKRVDPQGNTRYLYRQGEPTKDSPSGESLEQWTKRPDGGFARHEKPITNGPGNQAVDAASMARHAMGEIDGLFAHPSALEKDSNIDGISQYNTPEELTAKAEEYENRTGRPGRYIVDTGQLPDSKGDTKGHSGHQMALDFNPESGTFDDNTQTWGEKGDRPEKDMTPDQVLKAGSFKTDNISKADVQTNAEDALASSVDKIEQEALDSGLAQEALKKLYNNLPYARLT